MSLCFYVTVVALLQNLPLILSVNRGNFKKCDDSAFCKRLRKMEANKGGYLADSTSFKPLNSSSVEFDIKHEAQKHVHRAVIRVLADSTVRLSVQEKDPLRPRYSPVDSLNPAGLKDAACKLTQDTETATIAFSEHKLIVKYNPLRINVYTGEDLVASLNARGLFQVETQLAKPVTTGEEAAAEGGDAPPPPPEDDEDLGISADDIALMEWEESFKSHHDSNPRGPRAVALDITFTGFDKVYGLPEHADTFALKSTVDTDPYRLYNLDVFEYELNNPMALYGSIPYITALSATRSIGAMWLNAAETWLDVSYSSDKSLVGRVLASFSSTDEVNTVDTHWMSESGLLDVFLFLGPTPRDVSRQYSGAFGPSMLPPMFAVAYHQCRWNYNDQKDVLSVDENFDKYDIPMDVMWLDIEHTNGKRYFSWDARKFPDSKGMQNTLASKGRRMVTIVDPHIKVDKSWGVYKGAQDSPTCDVFVKNKDGNNFEGHCWPGTSSWVDYTSPCAREWWAEQFSFDNYQGTTDSLFTWNDMNEPSVFNGPEVTMPKDNLHAEGWEHRDVHNIYGHYMHRATAEAQIKRSTGTARPFVLSRAFFVGSHRIGPIWTGDNHASWEHLQMSIPMLLSLNVAGYPFVGADVGGFFGNPNTELLTRWYQAAIFQPFLRGHAHIDTRRREPWLFGEEVTANIRSALVLRYQLLPYIYTQFYKASVDNTPVIRPLWYDYTTDSSLYENQHEFMLGDGLLSSPVLASGESSHAVTLPGSKGSTVWYNFYTFARQDPGIVHIPVKMSSMPLFIRGGSIIPMKKRLRRSSEIMSKDPYTLYVALDPTGKANGDVYIDDGKSYEYKAGRLSYQLLSFDGKTLTSRSGVKDATYPSPAVERIVFIGLNYQQTHTASLNGKELVVLADKSNESVVIKKPGVLLSDEWTISIS